MEKGTEMSKTKKKYNNDRLLRLPEVLKIIPISKSSWWDGVNKGIFPAPIKLGPRTTCWRYSDVQPLVEKGV